MTDQIENSTSILALEAFEYVHKDKVEEYERLGVIIDDQVKETEPGMLVHALTRISETDSEVVYRWLEVFDSAEALEKHMSNPHVIRHAQALNSGVLCGQTELVIYSDWTEAQKNHWREKVSGVKLTFAPVLKGFYLSR